MKKLLFVLVAGVTLTALSGCCAHRGCGPFGGCGLLRGSCGQCSDCPDTCQSCDDGSARHARAGHVLAAVGCAARRRSIPVRPPPR